MLHALGRDGFAERRIYRKRSCGREIEYYYFVYSKRSHLESLFHYLYDDMAEHMYLARKYDAFMTYMARRVCASADRTVPIISIM